MDGPRSRRKPSYSRSPSPDRSRRERSRSPPRRRDDDRPSHREDRSLPRREPLPSRDDRPRYDDRRDQRNDRPNGNGYRNGHANGYSGNGRPAQPPAMSEEARAKAREMAAARLAEMQASAKDISSERAGRLAKLEAEDAERLAQEEELRQKAADGMRGKGTGKAGPGFLLDAHKKLGDQSLGDVIKGRGRAGLVRDRDE